MDNNDCSSPNNEEMTLVFKKCSKFFCSNKNSSSSPWRENFSIRDLRPWKNAEDYDEETKK